jgi:hypothetical protein
MNVKDQIKLQTKLLGIINNSKEELNYRELTFLVTLVNHSHVNKMFTDEIY